MARSLSLILLTLCSSYAVEVPTWIVKGILRVETGSYVKNGQVVYVDTRVGKHGERGAGQMSRAALHTVAPGTPIHRLETDPAFAVDCTKKYLLWLYAGPANGSWLKAIAQYNAGPSCHSITRYVKRVQQASGISP
jgi:hypothetical protein